MDKSELVYVISSPWQGTYEKIVHAADSMYWGLPLISAVPLTLIILWYDSMLNFTLVKPLFTFGLIYFFKSIAKMLLKFDVVEWGARIIW